jgi:hypothetical protein
VTCDTVDAEILYAKVDDIYKLLKNEKRVIKFLTDQFREKYPNKLLTDNFFEQAFSNTIEEIPDSTNRPQSQPGVKSGEQNVLVKQRLREFGIQNVNDLLLN